MAVLEWRRMNGRVVIAFGAVAASMLTSPAVAVDYVQCREMRRTINEMGRKGAKLEVAYMDKLMAGKCDYENFQTEEILGGVALNRTDWDAVRACRDNFEIELARIEKPYVTWSGVTLWSPDAIETAKVATKIADDMKSAGCPYS